MEEDEEICSWLQRPHTHGAARSDHKMNMPPPIETLLMPPASLPYNLKKHRTEKTSISQLGQDMWVDEVLGHMKDGFVLESGAYDGETHSNSLFFELFRNWQCLLVEADPHSQDRLASKNRRCHVLKAGLSVTDQPSMFDFKEAAELGGIMDTFSTEHQNRITKEIAEGTNMADHPEAGAEVSVPAYPLNMVMKQLNRTTIDYWSLDVEGAELSILQGTDFKTLEIGVITVEYNGQQQPIQALLEQNGFQLAQSGYQDDYYVNTAYFEKRGLDPEPFILHKV
eukprot:gnl/TRDRNA2_/TRDRNA2_160334_c0_seq1.p1 gnl/TRDRNA2_/TRDRNA2_160334_c0~~gnl/TRDRNA2_/TRDRNA2_160334_c0_seq1.p1  ORF type:complete len:324 (-),score=45.43 gnl/TRDRNA2_/TRDRNA2_160334_c0_seq1:108-953(-)